MIQSRDFGVDAVGFAVACTRRVLFLDVTILDFGWTSAVVVWEEGGGEPG